MEPNRTTTLPALIGRYGPDTRMASVPWEELPACLQKTCEHFLKRWWDGIEIDHAIETSGLSDMTLAELLAFHEKQNQPCSPGAERYRRIEPEDTEPLTYAEALSEKEQQELMCPENLYRIEELPEKGLT
jgi:hypothetical protein